MVDWVARTREAAMNNGVDSDIYERQIRQESGYRDDVIHCRHSSSAGAEGIAQIMRVFHGHLVDPCDPIAALDYGARLMRSHLTTYANNYALALSAYNAGAGATAQFLRGEREPYQETVNYVAVILQTTPDQARRWLKGEAVVPIKARTYDPAPPLDVYRQKNQWSCAVRSTWAALWSIQQNGHLTGVDYEAPPLSVYDLLVPEFDDANVGLKDASGSGIVAALSRWGVQAFNKSVVTLQEVQEKAGTMPVLIGGRNWNHWVYVRGVQEDGTLLLSNPAGTFMGISNELRDSFDRLGPFSMVWIPVPTTNVEPEKPVDPTEKLQKELEWARTVNHHLTVEVARALRAAVDELERHKGSV